MLEFPNKSLKCSFMHGQEELFSLTSLIELEGNYLNSELSSLHVQLCGDKEKEKNTRTQVRVHDIYVNGMSKFGPNLYKHTTSFCILFLYVSNAFLIEIPSRLRYALTLDGFSP
jgi:hypothetical protein